MQLSYSLKLKNQRTYRLATSDERLFVVLEYLAAVFHLQRDESAMPALELRYFADEGDYFASPMEAAPVLPEYLAAIRSGSEQERNIYLGVIASALSNLLSNQIHLDGGVFLHGALAEFEGKGVLMIGKSGIGKSTTSGRLREPWRALCDDTAVIVQDDAGQFWAHPWPTWSRFVFVGLGGDWDVQRAVPLTLVSVLRRGERVGAAPLGQAQAFALLLQANNQITGTEWKRLPQDLMRTLRTMVYSTVIEINRRVLVEFLDMSLETEFWKSLEPRLLGQKLSLIEK